jgi:hypothetical protein
MASSLTREDYGKAGGASRAVRGDGGVPPVRMCCRLSRRRRGGVSPVEIPKLPQEKKTHRRTRAKNAGREEEERIFERERERKKNNIILIHM